MHGEGTLHGWLLVLHILASMVWVGATALVVIVIAATWDMVFEPGA